jgi:UDPglucose--hexose-1-phosphate uridylyltransferase
VLIVPGRAGRPGAMGRTTRVSGAATCPFCEGHEALTPPEVAALGRPGGEADTPGWKVRVVPNKFPAFAGQEVVIHGPRHVTSLGDVDTDVMETVVTAWSARRGHHRTQDAEWLLIGINEGAGAGASLEHSHSQLVPFDAVPPVAAAELQGFAAGCPLCPPPDHPVGSGEGLVTFCPPWSCVPFETWIAPVDHESRAPLDAALAHALSDAVSRLRALIGDDLAWNAIVHDAPLRGDHPRHHWHVEILPRLTVAAAVELGAGIWVNVVEPERAARELAGAAR